MDGCLRAGWSVKQLGIFSLIVIIAIAIIRGPVTGILRGFGDGAVVTIEDVPGTYFVDKQNRWPTVLNTFKGEMAGCVSLIHLINHRWQVLVEIVAETITKPCGEKTARKLTDAIIDTLKPLPHGV